MVVSSATQGNDRASVLRGLPDITIDLQLQDVDGIPIIILFLALRLDFVVCLNWSHFEYYLVQVESQAATAAVSLAQNFEHPT